MALRIAFRPRPFICCGCLRLSSLRSSSSSPKRRLSSSQTAASDTATTPGAGGAAGNTRSGTHGSSLAAQSTSTGKSASEHDSTNIETRSSDPGAGSAIDTHNRDRPPPEPNRSSSSSSSSEPANGPRIGKLLVDLRTPKSTHASRRRPSDHAGKDVGFKPSSTVVVKGIGTTFLEQDIRRLVPRKKHFPDIQVSNDILRVIPCRDVRSFDRGEGYHLTFSSPAAAQAFAKSTISAFATERAKWPDVPLPPAATPEFMTPDLRATNVTQQEYLLQHRLSLGGAGPGRCVLLTACGPGGRRKSEGKLPRTEEVRSMLEELDVKLCPRDLEDGGVGVERIVMDNIFGTERRVIKADGKGLGAEGRWLIRCASESEAQRVVRELHRRPPWKTGGGCIFGAEAIY